MGESRRKLRPGGARATTSPRIRRAAEEAEAQPDSVSADRGMQRGCAAGEGWQSPRPSASPSRKMDPQPRFTAGRAAAGRSTTGLPDPRRTSSSTTPPARPWRAGRRSPPRSRTCSAHQTDQRTRSRRHARREADRQGTWRSRPERSRGPASRSRSPASANYGNCPRARTLSESERSPVAVEQSGNDARTAQRRKRSGGAQGRGGSQLLHAVLGKTVAPEAPA